MERWEAALQALEGLIHRNPEATREVSKRGSQGKGGRLVSALVAGPL